jgi:glycosyltransferase involved in cell wall biosynthesis
VRELARSLPLVRPEDKRLFVLRPELVDVVREHDPAAQILIRPDGVARLPARIAWEHVALPTLLRSFAPDVVFSPFNVIPVRWRTPQPRLVVMISNLAPFAPECLDVCTPDERRRNTVLRALTLRSVRHADRVIILSRQALDLIDAKGRWQSRAELVPQAPPPIPPVHAGAQVWPRPYFVVIADWYKFKGIESVVEALGHMAAKLRPDVVIGGRLMETDYVTAVEARAEQLGVSDRVHVVGQLPHTGVLAYMRGALACVAPSRFENLSRVTAEAMAAGTPVVARDAPSYREACGQAAAYFRSDEDLAELLLRVSTDSAFRENLSRRGSAHVASMSADTGAARIADVLAAVGP